jgi:rRNA maturation RNase YbeY
VSVSTHFLPPVGADASVSSRRVSRIVETVFRSEKKKRGGDVNVVFVDAKTIRRLNKKFLNTAGDTDVIAFPYEKNGGDIYICMPVAKSNARRYDEPLGRELTRLVIHGTLHLLGYADWPKKQKEKMWARQEPLVERLWRPAK